METVFKQQFALTVELQTFAAESTDKWTAFQGGQVEPRSVAIHASVDPTYLDLQELSYEQR